MKIKVRPDDFIVREKINLPLLNKGDFVVYSLTKSGWNTTDLLRELSRRCKVSLDAISYGGRKDRHGLTTQYITVFGRRLEDIIEEKYSFTFAGYSDTPMEPAVIEANEFDITARDIDKEHLASALDQVEAVRSAGFVNYFDDQRLASFDKVQGFFAEKILKKQFNGALKIYITAVSSSDGKQDRERKRFFFENWKDWQSCRAKAVTRFEAEAFDRLIEEPAAFLELVRNIPYYDLSIYCSAYQSFLWNEIARFVIESSCSGKVRAYPGLCGDYVFPSEACVARSDRIKRLKVPVPGLNPAFGDTSVKLTYMNVLKDNGLRQPLFNNSKFRNVIFKSFQRPVIAAPADLAVSSSDDELYPGKKKMRLVFRLGRGSYATMLIKRLFSACL